MKTWGKRTNHPGVKAVATAMTQAETYGTPLANALRVMAKENRDLRLSAAEKKAGRPAGQTDRADDPVLPAGAVHRHPGAGDPERHRHDEGGQLGRFGGGFQPFGDGVVGLADRRAVLVMEQFAAQA